MNISMLFLFDYKCTTIFVKNKNVFWSSMQPALVQLAALLSCSWVAGFREIFNFKCARDLPGDSWKRKYTCLSKPSPAMVTVTIMFILRQIKLPWVETAPRRMNLKSNWRKMYWNRNMVAYSANNHLQPGRSTCLRSFLFAEFSFLNSKVEYKAKCNSYVKIPEGSHTKTTNSKLTRSKKET